MDQTTAETKAVEPTPTPAQRKVVLVSMPTYGGKMEAGILLSMMNAGKRQDIAYTVSLSDTSANCTGMNMLWIKALELAEQGQITHFLMHHSDIVPEYGWLDKMMEVMERTGADVLSAIVPIKDHQGFTSTALDEPIGDHNAYWRMRRLTMKEIFQRPPTFTDPKLLLNDGLMLIDMRKPWVEKVCFRFEDTIIRHHGKRVAACVPEDWGFSRQCRAAGASLWATREVSLKHVGTQQFPNTYAWGTADTDGIAHCPGVPTDMLTTVDSIEGWFTVEEAATIYLHAKKALEIAPAMVEVGSYKGRSTYVLAHACKDNKGGTVFAVDPHQGDLYANGQGIKFPPSLEEFNKNMERTGVREFVHPVVKKSSEVEWTGEPISLLFIDGLHDYENVAADFEHFIKWVPEGGYVCFHDYAQTDPDVMRFVDEEIGLGSIEKVTQTGSLLVCRVPKGINKGVVTVPNGPGFGV